MKTLTFSLSSLSSPSVLTDSVTVCIAEMPDVPNGGRRDVERAVVADIVSRHLGPGFTIAHRPDGAPYLYATPPLGGWGASAPPHISITHSRSIAAVAFSADTPVGIDAEEWRDALLRVRARFLSPAEMEIFTTPDQLLTAWTVKEAVYKLAGSSALDFAASIAISPDMTLARACGLTYRLTTFTDGPTTITLAHKSNSE